MLVFTWNAPWVNIGQEPAAGLHVDVLTTPEFSKAKRAGCDAHERRRDPEPSLYWSIKVDLSLNTKPAYQNTE